MALQSSVVLSCGKCFSGKRLASAIMFQHNAKCRNMRFYSFIFKLSNVFSRSKHKCVEKLSEQVGSHGVKSISVRPKLLDKVSVLMGYNSHDLVDNERAGRQSATNHKDSMDGLEVSLACKRFPSIILGSSPQVELYDETASFDEMKLYAAQSYEGFISSSSSEEQVQDSLHEMDLTLPSKETSLPRDDCSLKLPLSSELLVTEGNSNQPDTIYEFTWPKSQNDSACIELHLDRSISFIPGLSKRICCQLEKCGFHTFRKLLLHFPRTYADLFNAKVGIEVGQYFIFIGKILSSRGFKAGQSFSIHEIIVGCEMAESESTSNHKIEDTEGKTNKTIHLHLMKYFRGTRFTIQPFLRSIGKTYKEGEIVCVSGKVRCMRSKDHYEMREYHVDVLHDEKDSQFHVQQRPYPIYPSKGGLKPNLLRGAIARALQALPINIDPIPENILREFGLLSLHDAYTGMHMPKNIEEADLARKRFIFDEFFYMQIGRMFQMLQGLGTIVEKDGFLDKCRKPVLNATYMEKWSTLAQKLVKVLPFSLTSSQVTAASEIIWDLRQPVPMNRLLQGDVGCGKTIVAFLACMEVIGSGYQAAYMVPTELLAIQHFEYLNSLLEKMEDDEHKPTIALLTASTRQARLIRKDLQSGDISMVIGTQSLITEEVEFSALRIAVVDEQQRFGVIQRGRFNSKLLNTSLSSSIAAGNSDETSKAEKYMAPHILAMSATPIPRTLALALYGDVSLTQITDLPSGRTPVETLIVEGTDSGFENVYKIMQDELEGGGKIFLVYPIIEQSEQVPRLRAASVDFEDISCRFEGYNCGLLHGKMKVHEKGEVLRRFRSGETRILLSTQVIEIGIDVPDASLMVVMNAERFGIAQLHQLRGRVGRGVKKSKCILVACTASCLNRLKVLQKSSDCFYLANMDLALRGPGDLLGKKQSGHLPEFPIARLEIDGNILQDAHLAALKILSVSHDLERFSQLKAELSMRQPLSLMGD